jgi:NAD(P)-dependent dehydrogenase (short-subunit alcohol dehydrogenase family)
VSGQPQYLTTLPSRVLVVGAAGGIGRAVADALLAAGVSVLGTDRRERPDDLACDWVAADIATAAGRAAIVEASGPLGGMVYAAGIIDSIGWQELGEDEAARILAVNLTAPLFLTRALAGQFTNPAAIVLVGSIAGTRGSPLTPVYAASKAALRNLGASLALALSPDDIRVNVVAPGLIDTPLTDGLNLRLSAMRNVSRESIEAERAAAIPVGRAGSTGEVADAVLHLLGDGARYTTGATLFVAGGVMAGSV